MTEKPEAPKVEWKDGPAEPGPRVYTVTDLPLHVRVAQALGWTDLHHISIEELKEHDHWTGKPPEGWPGPFPSIVSGIDMKERVVVHTATVPRFDVDWAATGPLIEHLEREGWDIHLSGREGDWIASAMKGDCNCPHRKPYDEKDGHGFTHVTTDIDEFDDEMSFGVALCYLVLLIAKENHA